MVKVLYAEDEVFLGKIVKETLESRGFAVDMAATGTDAVERFAQQQPDICVLDIMMPGLSGYEVALEIRKHNKQVPILFLTAKTQTEDVVKGFAEGGNDYLKKPFSMEELIARMHNLLQLTGHKVQAHTDADTLPLGSYRFNLPRQVLSGPGDDKKLSYREAELLKYLYENRGSIIDRRDLLNAIWGNDNFFNSRNLDVYITKLRGYLKADPTIEILTIKGVGYRFVLEI